jgi:hypothetical protein
MLALPVLLLGEGGRGCGGCHRGMQGRGFGWRVAKKATITAVLLLFGQLGEKHHSALLCWHARRVLLLTLRLSR